mmetsp:Transcript_3308/g.7193  ORF Transcript_3308/g.7193 Transcript_3308/m.7193 type:complete len:599 (+) Transcript_3308:472-2268(+)
MTASTSATPDVLSYLHQRVLERNEFETDPFQSVHHSNLALQNTVDNLQYQCEVLQKEKAEQDRIIDQLNEEIDGNNNNEGGSSSKGGKGSGPSKTEARQRDKIEKLQEQLNDKLRAEVEASASALKVANELAEVKDANAAHMSTIKALQEEQTKSEKTITKLNAELTNAQSIASLAEKQYEGLKDTIRTLQEENDELKQTNSDLVNRVVSEKEKSIDEINKMNDMVEKLKKEVDMLRAYQKQQEQRARGGWRRNKGGGLDIGGDDSSSSPQSSAATGKGKDGNSGRQFGALGVVVPSQPLHVLQAHGQEATAVRYDGTGTDLVATGSSDSTVRVWDSSTGQPKAMLRGGVGHPMLGVDISGGVVAGCGSDKTCRVWNLRTQRLIHQLAGHSHKITCVRLFHNEKDILTGSADRSMKVWDISRNVYRQTVTFRHSSTSNYVDVSSDSLTAVSAHMDGGLRFWDVRSGERSAEIAGIHEGGVTSVQFSPTDNTKLLTNGRDSTLKLVDVRTCTTVQTLRHPDFRTMMNHVSAALSPDGVYAAAGSGTTGDVFVWRVSDGKLEKKLSAHQAGVCGVAWGRGGTNGQQVASVDKNGVLVLWA